MATDSGTRIDPSADEVSNYDYQNETVARSGLVDDLQARVNGEVRFDEYSRQLYATDASLYEVLPIGVVYPQSTEDVAAVMSYCAQREIPVLPRGGGTSLAGQTVNEAVVLDFSRYMNDLVGARPDDRRARAQPGIKLGDLNGELADHGLKFAPDPAWGDKSVLGGAIGNNSTGAHSLQYGKTDAYIEECEVVLADGTVTTFGEVTREELRDRADPDGDLEARIYAEIERILAEEGEEIESHYPDLKRNVSGYNLDWVLDDAQDGTINVASLLAGSEGTLAIVTEAEVSLEPIPETKSMGLLAYEGLIEAMEDVADILEHDPAAVEVLDDVLIDLAQDTAEFEDVVGMLPEGTRAVLIVEFYADDEESGRQKVADLLVDRTNGVDPAADPTADRTVVDTPIRAFDAMEAHDEAKREKFWKMRKSGLPILLSRTTDEKHGSFIEDTAIPPANLPEYVADFQEILEEHDTFASFYAHAGPGVLHIRPLINTKSVEGVETMESIADAVTDLVVKYGGSVSGEHGDGRARTQWNEKLYGPDLWETFQELKSAFDPDWLLNPGQVVGVDAGEVESGAMPERARTVDMTENLRFDPEYEFDAGFDPALEWDNDNGMQGMVELCHGCGGCRGPQETTGGVMCPTYRASEEEMTTTRGRANMLRQAMSGDLPDDPTDEEFMHEVLDLCIGCKGCAKDCPSEVDMAKLKAEVTHAYHQEHGSSLRDKVFANVDALAGLGSSFAPLSNLATKVPGARTVLEKAVGIAPDRTLPSFQRTTLQDWFDERGPQIPADEAERRALLFPDTYTNYSHPEVGKAAVRVLEAAGVHVQLADRTDSGRPAHSKGFLDQSRATARDNIDALVPAVKEGWDVVLVEPSDAVMFQSDYLDLLSGEDVETLAANAYGVCEYLDTFRLDEAADWDVPAETLTYHGHCHQKATKKDHHAVGVLRRAGYDVDPLDSGCCGMAGSFGYEAEHFSMSKAIGAILFDQIGESRGDTVVAPGASCRTQLDDWDESDGEPPHPVEKLDAALA
ncbi:putative oxidoreductase [Haloarcula marismortui ATCC 43049]|uniref:D-lactate dehydrogenase (cytochrome) n=1 Tax=Haloarcula marismortui (strain ATCC 43049 / DSM 3752 / JCM 8966 / VKM B-1809) TaxID=272569 RepID=Q5UZZ6_HALMA|nr:FAD-binding and (Fe-S)-binding domain-containing protein [Haloarcula marismortui]AAV47156.1 putative oxidoreductase [Haloarcula marismortui ATCC 43049]QCP91861.1 FAD-binding oxidoreductase [Haloarcula marismortui ATCC 43049]